MNWFGIAWHFVMSWAGIDMLVGFACVAVAILEPKQLDAITDLRKWAIAGAVVAFTLTGSIAYGYRNGIEVMQAQLAAALAREARDGEAALSDAERTVGPVSADRRVFDHDGFNRDRGKHAGGK